MLELLPITIFSFIMAGFSHATSKYNREQGCYEKKENIFYIIMAVVMILFIGLRTDYNDTHAYLVGFKNLDTSIPFKTVIENMDWSIGANPGFNLTNWIIKYIGFESQDFLMFYAIITVGIYLWFLRKYTCNIWLSIFLAFATGTYLFSLAAIKQCVAIAFCLIATDRAIEKKYIKFILWIIIAALFHPYSIMFLVVPFMMHKPWTIKTYLSLLFFGIFGFALQSMLGTIVDVTSMFGEGYDVTSLGGEGVNPFRLIVCSVPLILSFIMKKYLQKQETSESDNLILNLTILNAEIMFVGLFGTANYFARLANYFLIFQCLSIPWLFKYIDSKSRKTLTLIAVLCYLVYFVYEYKNFDMSYSSISIFEYIKLLLQQ